MTAEMLNLVLYTAMGLCALMAVVNLVRFKKRGPSAYALAAAFVALGFTLWLYEAQAAMGWIEAGIALTVLLLGADFGLRAAQHAKQDRSS